MPILIPQWENIGHNRSAFNWLAHSKGEFVMQKYEYLVVFLTDVDRTDDVEMDRHMDADHFSEQLNRYGEAGWELVSFDWDSPDGAKAAFKRPKS